MMHGRGQRALNIALPPAIDSLRREACFDGDRFHWLPMDSMLISVYAAAAFVEFIKHRYYCRSCY